MYTVQFWRDLLERATSTFAQAFLTLVGTNAAGWLEADWATIAATSAIAAVLSVLKGLVFSKVGSPVPSTVNYTYASGDHL